MEDLEDSAAQATVGRSPDEAGVPVVSIAGEVDMSNVLSIETQLEAVLAARPERLVCDVTGLEFIDSSGIALFLRAAERTGRLELRNPSSIVRRVIQATGLSDVLHVQS